MADDLYVWQPIPPAAAGTLCAGCQRHGVHTLHSPAGEQHKAWQARWEQDPDWAPDGAPPPFGEVVKAFTPSGTDFEEFKKSLHSQGAPGRISPQLVGMLNQIAPQMTGQTGGTCPRCDHPHGGPPGRACLEAEAHLGRSPLRRSPDLQLDAISGPRQRQADRPAASVVDRQTPGALAATAMHEAFLDLMAGGFTEDQALTILARAFAARNGGDNSG